MRPQSLLTSTGRKDDSTYTHMAMSKEGGEASSTTGPMSIRTTHPRRFDQDHQKYSIKTKSSRSILFGRPVTDRS